MLVIDDLHWADHGSLLLLQFLSTEVATASIIVIGTYRDMHGESADRISALLGSLSRQRGCDIVLLGGLRRSHVTELLQDVSGSPPTGELVTALMERTDGNPFFVREIATIIGTESLNQSDAVTLGTLLPFTVREVITRHLSAVSSRCRYLLDVGSVFGREFDVQLVGQAMQVSAEDLCAALDEALALKIVEPLRVSYYRFRHALVQETIFESLSIAVRAQTHLMLARVLESSCDARRYSIVSRLAYHFAMALPCGRWQDAYHYALSAGAEARRILAYEEAVANFQRALEVSGPQLDAASHCDLLLCLAEAQLRAGLWRESRSNYQEAAERARALGRSDQLARAAVGFKGLVGGATPVDTPAVALLQEALRTLKPDQDHLRVRVLSALAGSLYFADADDEVERYVDSAMETAERLRDPILRMLAIESRLLSSFRPTQLLRRWEAASELINLASSTADADMSFVGRFTRYACLLEFGEPLEALGELELAGNVCDKSKASRGRWQVELARSSLALARGELSESLELTQSARHIGEQVHDSAAAHYFFVQWFQYERVRGALAAVEHPIRSAVSQYPSVVGYRIALAAILADTAKKREAAMLISQLGGAEFKEIRRDALFLWTLAVLTEAVESCGEGQWCKPAYELLLPFRGHNVVMSWGVAFDGSAEHFLGMLSGALGEYDRGVEHFEAALAMNTKMGAVPLVARTQERYAALLVQRDGAGDAGQARELLEQAAETMERVGMVGHLARARATLERLQAARPQVVVPRATTGEAAAPAVAEAAPEYLFRREGDYWSVAFEGVLVRLRHTRGLALLAVLLQRPETDVHVFDLVNAVEGAPADPEHRRRPRELLAALARDAGPLADQRARAEYRRRAEELRVELAEAQACNDLGRIARLQEETAQLADELQRVYGRGGRSRLPASACERARINVRNNITYALGALKSAHAGVWRHMKAAVRTGTFCSYQPERAIPWAF